MLLGVRVQQSSDHALVLGVVPSRFALEELDAPLAQGDRDLDALVAEDEVFRKRKEVRNDLEFSERFVRVSGLPAHRTVCLSDVGL